MPNNILQQIGKFRNLGVLRFLAALKPEVSAQEYESAVGSVYRSFFTEGSEYDLKDHEQIVQLALKGGIKEDIARKVVGEIETEKVKDMLKANCERAVDLGAFGVPCTFVFMAGEDEPPEVFWGSDRNAYIAPLLGGKE